MAGALKIIGGRWTLLAVCELMCGAHRFNQIADHTGATRDRLADRLRMLEHAGLVERRQYCERPPRFEYHLTEAGQELYPILSALSEWGQKWAGAAPAYSLRHQCGHQLDLDQLCGYCGVPVLGSSVVMVDNRSV
nr:helix-turn-helix transcriptional regulator [Streptomyces sp. NBC_00886]